MKKKIILAILIALLALSSIFLLSACNTPSHTHAYSSEWSTDGTRHWHECECGAKKDIAEHIMIDNRCSGCQYVNYSQGLLFGLLRDNTYSVEGIGICTDTEIIIPETFNGKLVTRIGDSAFLRCNFLKSIVIPDSVTSIGKEAFYSCRSLTSIIIPDSVTSIGDGAFYSCDSLTSMVIPDSVTSIQHGHGYSFMGCPCLTIYCEPTARPSGWADFDGDCSVVWDCNNNEIADDGCIYTIIDGVRYALKDGIATVVKQPRSLTTANIKSSIEYKGVSYAVTSIGNSAFEYCNSLTNVVIPESVTSIGNYAFRCCDSLISIEVSEQNANYKDVDGNLYSKDGTTLIQYAIGKTAVSFTILDSVTSIGEYAFAGCSSLIIYCEATVKPSGWDSNWNYYNPVVWDCDNNDVATDEYIYTVIDGVRYALKDGVATVARQSRSLTTANIKSSIDYKGVSYAVTRIGDSAFLRCNFLKSIVIPDSVTSIGNSSFVYCDSLTSIVIPDSVTSIGDFAFAECDFLTIYCEAESKPSGWDEFWNYSGRPVVWGYKG